MKETLLTIGVGVLILGGAIYVSWAVFAVAVFYFVGMAVPALGVAISAILVGGIVWQVAVWADEVGV